MISTLSLILQRLLSYCPSSCSLSPKISGLACRCLASRSWWMIFSWTSWWLKGHNLFGFFEGCSISLSVLPYSDFSFFSSQLSYTYTPLWSSSCVAKTRNSLQTFLRLPLDLSAIFTFLVCFWSHWCYCSLVLSWRALADPQKCSQLHVWLRGSSDQG